MSEVSDLKKARFKAGEMFARYGLPDSPRLRLNIALGAITKEEVKDVVNKARSAGMDIKYEDGGEYDPTPKRKALGYDRVSQLLGMKERAEKSEDEKMKKYIDHTLETRDELLLNDVIRNRVENLEKDALSRNKEARANEQAEDEAKPQVFSAMEGMDSPKQETQIEDERDASKEARKKALQRMRGF